MGCGDESDRPGSCVVAPERRVEDSDGYSCGIKVDIPFHPSPPFLLRSSSGIEVDIVTVTMQDR